MTGDKGHAQYQIEALEKRHEKSEFKCGIDALDQYLKIQAGQDIKKNVAVTHVLIPKDSKKILGYYTLSAIGIFPGELPDDVVRRLPRYPVLPGVLIGRLAVDEKCQGQGLGEYLLLDSFKRSLTVSAQIGIVAVIVDAKDENAIAFYSQYGFIVLPSNDHRLFLPLSTIKQLNL